MNFKIYEQKFKALADERRLQILHTLTEKGETCVCDLTEITGLPQSKLSYHLKLLLDADFIKKETRGTWSYYDLNDQGINEILSEELCCIFRKPGEQSCC